MSPQFMAAQSGCSDACPCMPGLRARARRYRIAGFALVVLALAAIAASVPVDGLAGMALAFGGIAALWTGWYLVVRRAGRIDAELKAAAATSRTVRRLSR